MSRVVAEVSYPTAECPEPQRWSCFDAMSAEVEVLEFLANLVLTIKPKLIVETGTFAGYSALYMGKALKKIGRGKLITCEVDPRLHAAATELVKRNQLEDFVECRLQPSLEVKLEGEIDFLFSDSEPTLRVQEIEHFWKQLTPCSLIAIHDVNSGAHHALRREVLSLDANDKLSVVMLPTPRGLALAQKCRGRK